MGYTRHGPRVTRRLAPFTVPVCGLLALLTVIVEPALARQAGRSPSVGQVMQVDLLDGLGDIIVGALQELLRLLFSPIQSTIETHADALLEVVVATPYPDAVFGPPTNGAWPTIYDYYWETIVPVSLVLYGVAIGLVILLESTSHLFSNYHRTKLKKRAFSGLLGILGWWWIAALSLRFMDALASLLLPSLSNVSLFETLSFSGMGVIGLVLTMTADLTLFVLIALLYLVRHLVLYLFVLMMPLLIAFWIPGVGPFTLASGFVRKLAGFYVPFLFMSIPVALLFRLGGLLGQHAGFSTTGIGGWLTALVIPFAAVVSPFVLFTQAGQIQSVADRTAAEISATRGRRRVSGAHERVQQTETTGRNFARGMRGKPPVQTERNDSAAHSEPKAHRAGRRLKRVRDRVAGPTDGSDDTDAASLDSVDEPETTRSSDKDSAFNSDWRDTHSRPELFRTDRRTDSDDQQRDEEHPPYLQ